MPALLLGGKTCSDEDPCPAHECWREIRAANVEFLESTTLAGTAQSDRRGDLTPRDS